MGGDGIVKNYVKNQAFQVSLPKLHLVAPFDEIPVYDNAFIAKQAIQVSFLAINCNCSGWMDES